MKAILLLLSLLFSFLTPLKALDQINERLLEHAQQYHDSTGNLADLVDYLISAADNQRQQAEVIYYWISQNISYDIESLLDGSYLTDTADVWRSRKGVCEDYATLYKRMAELAGLECYVVRGYAVGYDYNGASPFEGINHSWNVVLVSGKFRFIDSCWGSGGIYSDGDEPQFVPLMQLQYVMIPVAASLPSHLPGDPMWQFRNRPYSIKDFVAGIQPSQSETIPSSIKDELLRYQSLTQAGKDIQTYTNTYKYHQTDQNLLRLILAYQHAGYALLQEEPSQGEIKRAALCYKRSAKLISKLKTQTDMSRRLADDAKIGFEYAKYLHKNRT